MRTIEFNFDNVSGISAVYAIPPSDIRRLDRDYMTGLTRIVLQPDADIIHLPVYAQQQTLFSEEQQLTDGYDIYDVSLSVFIPRQNDPLLMERLERGTWLVCHQDANGDILLSGTTDIPLNFIAQRQKGGEEATGTKGVFSAQEPQRSVSVDRRAVFFENPSDTI